MIEPSVSVRPAAPDEVSACVDLWVAAVAARDGVPESDAVRARAASKFAVPRVALVVAAGAADTIDGFALVTTPGTGRSTDPVRTAGANEAAFRGELSPRAPPRLFGRPAGHEERTARGVSRPRGALRSHGNASLVCGAGPARPGPDGSPPAGCPRPGAIFCCARGRAGG